MERSFGGHSVTKNKGNKIVIPQDIIDTLDKMPVKLRKTIWYPWIDETLIRYYHTKSIRMLSDALHIHKDIIASRIRYLKNTGRIKIL